MSLTVTVKGIDQRKNPGNPLQRSALPASILPRGYARGSISPEPLACWAPIPAESQPCDSGEGSEVHHFMPWQESARCRDYDPEIFFPEKGGSSREAKRICADCPVRIECLNYALRRDERYGVWGGMSERERRRLKRMAS